MHSGLSEALMADANQLPKPAEEALPPNYRVGAITTTSRPEEMSFPLTDDEFKTFCDGTNGVERAGRDLYVGLCAGSLVGLVGILATANWSDFWATKNWHLLLAIILLACMTLGSLVGCCIHGRRMSQEDTAYSRLKIKISDFFKRDAAAKAGGKV
jgi:hypothetical protein